MENKTSNDVTLHNVKQEPGDESEEVNNLPVIGSCWSQASTNQKLIGQVTWQYGTQEQHPGGHQGHKEKSTKVKLIRTVVGAGFFKIYRVIQ